MFRIAPNYFDQIDCAVYPTESQRLFHFINDDFVEIGRASQVREGPPFCHACILNLEARLSPDMKRRPESKQGELPTLEQLALAAKSSDKTSAQPWVPDRPRLPAIRKALPACRGCDLYLNATQAVPGSGANHVSLFLVGEQPGDQEDLKGEPFVGPAGRVLHRACSELGIDPSSLYVTNAVKHFKFTPRGKLRIHQSPRMSEITACRPWLLAELAAVRPRVVLCLGATAAKSLLGNTFSLTRDRGRMLSVPAAEKIIATFHPSAILRANTPAPFPGGSGSATPARSPDELYDLFKLDLQIAHEAALAA